MSSSRKARIPASLAIFFALTIGASSHAQAPPSVDTLRDRYPSSSIDSIERADRALADTNGSKERVEKAYKAQARACLGKILVNSCVDTAREERRHRMADIDAIELEANRYKRAEHDRRVQADRTRREAERDAHAPDDAAQRERNRAAYDDKQKQAASDAAERAKSGANRKPKVTKPGAALQPPVAADQREKNAAGFEHRKQAAADHQRDLARRQVEKDADRKRRAEAKAAKDAKTAAAAAARRPANVTPPATAVRP